MNHQAADSKEQLFDLETYLRRIHYQGGTDVSADTLRSLHASHVFNIPFENIDVKNNKPVSLAVDDLYRKIVLGGRGGYCFEMNGLFSFVLKACGFNTTDLLARVWTRGTYYSAKMHHVMLVRIGDQSWVADVGFGGNGPVAPVLLAEQVEQEQAGRSFRIVSDPDWGYVVQYKAQGEFVPLYAFTLEKTIALDYEQAHYYTSTHPASFFRQNYLCTKPTPDGRITVYGNVLKVIENGVLTETPLESDAQILECIRRYFGLNIPEPN